MVIALGFCLSLSAHTLKPIGRATDATMNKFIDYAKPLCNDWFVMSAYKIEKVSPVNAGESKEQTMERVIRYALHRDYPITGDDGGYSFKLVKGQITAKDLVKLMGTLYIDVEQYQADQASAILAEAASNGLWVYIGTGSGNNTMAYIVAIADPKTDEIIYTMNSNFGSDN
ncbi:MAG: hypothetical protein PHW04_13350 [Candidatus Wallbacteria bacterium]|nr:hypothetical protein [Candidatus Wallbacteria bacterium]